jgi:hypothetical protein
MQLDHVNDHEHELSAEYLYPADAAVLDVAERDGALVVTVAVPCPSCSETLALTATVETVEEADVTLPLDEEYYD